MKKYFKPLFEEKLASSIAEKIANIDTSVSEDFFVPDDGNGENLDQW